MIEVVEGKKPDSKRSHVKQVGRIGDEKVYIEDYVITFLKQCIRANTKEQAVVLYGRKEIIDKNRTWFVSGVLKVPESDMHNKTLITEHDWRLINEQAATFFPGLGVVGFAMYGLDELAFLEERIENTFIHFFREDQKLFLYFDEDQMEGDLFFYEQDKLNKQEGFFEYYEKNEQMQNYMLHEQEEKGEIKTGANETSETGNDHATRQFRAMLAQKKKDNAHRKALLFMYGLSAVLAVVIVMIGVTIIGNYDQMTHMQNTLSELSGQVETGFAQGDSRGQVCDVSSEITVSDNASVAEQIASQEVVNREETVEVLQSDLSEEKQIEEGGDGLKEQKEESTLTQTEGTVVPAFYEIRKGDTLEKISIRFYGNEKKVHAICELNHIEDQDTILYGQKIVLP